MTDRPESDASPARRSIALASYLSRLIWIAVGPLVFVAAGLAMDQVADARQEVDAKAQLLANGLVSSVDRGLRSRMRGMSMVAEMSPPDPGAALGSAYGLAQTFQRNFGGHLILADAQFQMLFNTRSPLGTPLPALPRPKGRAAAPEALARGQPAVGDTFFGPIAKQQLVAIAVPVLRGGRPVAVLVGTFDSEWFEPLLDAANVPAGWTAAVRDSTGRLIAGRGSALEAADPGARSTVRRYAAASALSPWSIVVEVPAALHTRSMLAAALGVGGGLLLATVAGVVGGRVAGRRLADAMASLTGAGTDPPRRGPAIAEVSAIAQTLADADRQRHAAEQALHESERTYRLLFDANPSPMGVWDLASGRILAVNDASIRHYGYSREEFLALSADDLWLPDELPRYRAALSQRRVQGQQAEPPVGALSSTHLTKDGRRIDVEISGTDIALPGAAARLVLIRDVTEVHRAERERQAAAEQALQASGRLGEAMLRIGDSVIALDRLYRFTFANPRALGAFGCRSESELLGQSIFDRLPPVPDDRFRRAIVEAVTANETRVVRHRSTSPGQWFESRVHPGAEGVSIYSTDITEEVRTLDALRRSEQQHRLLFDANPSPMWVFDVQTLAFMAVNSAAVERYGYSRAEFLAMTVADIRPSEDLPRLQAAVAAQRDPLQHRYQPAGPWSHRTKDGRLIDVEIASADLSFDGRAARLVLAVDVSERLRSERERDRARAAMLASEERFHALFRESMDLMFIGTADGGILAANPAACRALQYSEDQLREIGRGGVMDLLDERMPALLAQRDATGSARGEIRMVRADGSRLPVDLSTVLLRDPSGALITSVIARDITERVHAEAALRASERNFRLLAEQMPAIIYRARLDPPGAAEYVSPRIIELGYTPEQWLATPGALWQAVHPDDVGHVRAVMTSAFASGQTQVALEYRMRNADGSWRHVSDHACIVRPSDGSPPFALGVNVDVTPMRQAEAALRHSEREFRTLAEQLPAIVYRAELTHGQPARYVSPYIASLGYSVAQWTSAAGPHWADVLHPDDAAPVLAQLQAAAASHRPVALQYRVRDRAGAWRHFIDHATVVEDAGERPTLQGVMVEITALKHTEQALREAEVYQRSLFEAIGDGVMLLDGRRRVVDANPAAEALLGLADKALLGRSFESVVVEAERERVAELILSLHRGGKPRVLQWELRRDDGTAFPAEVSAHAADLEHVVMVVRDVTERQAAERALMATQMELSELAQRLLTQERETMRHMAQTLHDNLGQSLTVARLYLDATNATHGATMSQPLHAAYQRLGSTLDQAIADVRLVLGDLRPPMLEDQGLVAALDNEIRIRSAEHADTDILLEADGSILQTRWPPDVEYAAFRIAREAIVNAQLHAGATLVRVIVEGDSGQLSMEVVDDGRGIPEALRRGRPGHLGLVGMRERALAIGARFAVDTAEGGGACVRLNWEAPCT